MKKPKRKRDWHGLKVRSRQEFRNGLGSVPAGTVFTVERNFSGMHLISDPCQCCGVRFRISKVPEADVEIIEAPPDA